MGSAGRSVRIIFGSVLALVGVATTAAAGPLDGATNTTFTASALNSYSARLTWTLPAGATRIQLFRAGQLRADFPATLEDTYADYLLWQSNTYTYELKAYDSTGATIADLTAIATTPAQVGAFPRLYADSSFWNRPIKAGTRTDPSSASIVAASITAFRSLAVLNTNDHWGVPLAYANPQDHMYDVACRNPGCAPSTIPFRIPAYAQPNYGSDGKLTVVDPATNTELDMGRAVLDAEADSWSTGNRVASPSDGWGAICDLGQHCSGVVASGLAQFGGVVRPEEFAQGHIDHALAIVSPHTNATYFVCPATRLGGGYDDPAAIPLGAHLQLDPRFKVDAQAWPSWEKIVAKALQTYGAFVTDAGSSLEVRAESTIDRGYDAWAKVGIPDSWPGGPTLTDLPWDRVRVLTMRAC